MNFKYHDLTKDLSFRARLAADVAIEDIKKEVRNKDNYRTIADLRYDVFDFLSRISSECRDYIVVALKADIEVYRVLGDIIQECYPDLLLNILDNTNLKPYFEDRETITFLKDDIRKNLQTQNIVIIDKELDKRKEK